VAVFAISSADVQGHDLAEMKTVDGQRDCHREKTRMAEQSPEEEPPVLDALDAADTEFVHGSPQRQEILGLELDSDFGGWYSRRNVITRS